MFKVTARPIIQIKGFIYILYASDYTILKDIHDYENSLLTDSYIEAWQLERIVNQKVRESDLISLLLYSLNSELKDHYDFIPLFKKLCEITGVEFFLKFHSLKFKHEKKAWFFSDHYPLEPCIYLENLLGIRTNLVHSLSRTPPGFQEGSLFRGHPHLVDSDNPDTRETISQNKVNEIFRALKSFSEVTDQHVRYLDRHIGKCIYLTPKVEVTWGEILSDIIPLIKLIERE